MLRNELAAAATAATDVQADGPSDHLGDWPLFMQFGSLRPAAGATSRPGAQISPLFLFINMQTNPNEPDWSAPSPTERDEDTLAERSPHARHAHAQPRGHLFGRVLAKPNKRK